MLGELTTKHFNVEAYLQELFERPNFDKENTQLINLLIFLTQYEEEDIGVLNYDTLIDYFFVIEKYELVENLGMENTEKDFIVLQNSHSETSKESIRLNTTDIKGFERTYEDFPQIAYCLELENKKQLWLSIL